MIPVTINQGLNIRSRPDNASEQLGTVDPSGKIIPMRTKVEGVNLNGINQWYCDYNMRFYWAGGCTAHRDPSGFFTNRSPISKTDSAVAPYLGKWGWVHDQYNIPFIWQQLGIGNLGRGVKVVVIDTGIDLTNTDIVPAASVAITLNGIGLPIRKPLAGLGEISNDLHGTQMASIIAAKGKNLVAGIAPNVSLLVAQAITPRQAPAVNDKVVADAIDWAAEQGADVISMSFCTQTPLPFTLAALQRLPPATAVFVASGDAWGLNNFYPAQYARTKAIGAHDGKMIKLNDSSASCNLWALAPGLDVPAYGPGHAKILAQQTSAATAVAAAAYALLLSCIRQKNPNSNLQNALIDKLQQDCVSWAANGSAEGAGNGYLFPFYTFLNFV